MLYLLCVSLTLCMGSSFAMIDLELTQGVAASIPIGMSFTQNGFVPSAGHQSVSEVITNDLQNSGEFRVLGSQLTHGDAPDWRALGADYVVTGSIAASGSNKYVIHIQLSTVVAKNRDDVLLDATYTASASALRGLAHHVSDRIYEKLTGVRGIFTTKIAYIVVTHPTRQSSHYALQVSDADGFNAETLLSSEEPIMSPAWSPDGRQLAYVSFEGHRASIYLQDLVTAKRFRLSAVPGINGAPSFSPDGRTLAMVLSKSGNPNIYFLDLQTRQYRAMTKDGYIDTEPRFSPDGQSFLFTSNRDGSPQVYRYSIASGQASRISYSGNYNARPSYVPNSEDIVMMHRTNHLFGIARLDSTTGQIQTLVETGADESPSIAPNGKMVIYATQYGGRGVLAQVSVDGRIKLRLPAREGSVQEPAWSPFL
ncbi:MAG: Tol-Pal system beta propeller repeat protein TolB [Coxiella sp. RIFCSPHIGHO2_12_FULL_42_15]|nr:MAG: Tol-Pal system beta propeller repeat protein TolB [Coxiella sp. RIFCSPHIGHO2_12_FULL_42_15]